MSGRPPRGRGSNPRGRGILNGSGNFRGRDNQNRGGGAGGGMVSARRFGRLQPNDNDRNSDGGQRPSNRNLQHNFVKKELGFRKLLDILQKDPDAAVVELNRTSSEFAQLVSQADIRTDLLILLTQIISDKLCSDDLNLKPMRNPLLAKVCTPEFMKQLWDLTYRIMQEDSIALHTKISVGAKKEDVDKSPIKVFGNLLSFYDEVSKIMPTLAIDLLPGNITAAKLVLKMLREKTPEGDIQASFLKLESNFTTLESRLQESIRANKDKQLRDEGFQSRPSTRKAFSKGETERLYMDNPPEDFRTLPVAPTKEELRSEELPFLRPSIEKGSYPSADVYLDVQFRLLREDFMAPLREGIQDYLKFRHEYSSKRKRMPFGTVRVYRDVQIRKVKLDGDMTVYSLNFATQQFKKVNWEKSKRLLTGSLLCLTSDDFQSLYLATVVFRRLEDLKRGFVDVIWEGAKPDIGLPTSYLMMECEVYYEAYRHTLAALKEIELDNYPMKKYIVDGNTEEVSPPSFLDETEHLFDFGAMYKGALEKFIPSQEAQDEEESSLDSDDDDDDDDDDTDDTDDDNTNLELPIPVKSGLESSLPLSLKKRMFSKGEISPLDLNSWPTAIDLGMDNSQYSAFQLAVTRELSVIQGPPGTGKTYIGLQIAKLFLTNPKIYSTGSPILIVCYTNHALDQFLEGIIDVMEKLGIDPEDELIRIGSRSKSENLAKYSIQARVQDARKHRRFSPGYAQARSQKYHQLQDLQQNRSNLMDELKGLSRLDGIVDFNELSVAQELKGVCPLNMRDIIFGKFGTINSLFSFQIPHKLATWLGLNRNDFERDRDFVPYFLLRRWFKISDGRSKSQPSSSSKQPTVPTSQSEDPEKDEDGEAEEEYDMDELMAHRIEIFMEMETTRVKRNVEKMLQYIISCGSINKYTSKVMHRRNELIRILGNPEMHFSRSLVHPSEQSTLLQKYRKELEVIDEKKSRDLTVLKNKQGFLQYLMNLYYDEGLELVQVNQELLKTAHNMEKGTEQASLSDRWAIYFYFIEEAKKLILKDIVNVEEDIMRSQKELQAIDLTGQVQLLKRAMFVGLTTTGAAKYNTLLRMMKSPIVIVEEAAEVLESHIVTSITKYCQQLILIGDHKQLRPSTNVYKLAKDYNLDISLFERLINNDISSCQLRVQHRMRPNICKLLVPTIYTDLENHPCVSEYPRIPGVTKTLYFINHTEPENLDDDSATKSNVHEATFLVKLCRYLILQGYLPSQITIITTYLGQMFLLKKLNMNDCHKCRGVRITVVDNFQGEENDIILLSLVRSNAKNNIGFLKTDNRICVALSRAKHGLFVIGNMTSLVGSGSTTWHKIKQDLEQENNIGGLLELKCEVHGDITIIEKMEDFEKVPEGGCSQMCEQVLPCEHICQSVCHSYDRDHKEYKCQLPCKNQCPNQHPCKKLCYMDCGNCMVRMDKLLPCNHIENIECYMPANVWGCMKIVDKELPCGHKKLLNCKTDPATINCHESVEKTLPCEHKQVANCYQNKDTILCKTILQKKMPKCDHEVEIECHIKDKVNLWKCRKACDIQLDCGHTCGKVCHVDKDPDHEKHVCKKTCGRTCPYDHTCQGNHECRYTCPNCEVAVSRKLPCGHTKTLQCYVDVNSVLCDEVCDRPLECGHNCLQKCHLECLCKVTVTKKSVDCVHEIELECYKTPNKEFCYALVTGRIPAACGHNVLIPCKIADTGTPEEFLKFCGHPCNELLKEGNCGHKCKGNCATCFQGRIHRRCDEKCGRILACGHSCKFPCAALCPPCKEKCNFACEHSKCTKECGYACTGCNEPCSWKCSHAECKKLCREKCDRKPCDMPCTIPIPKCGHSCIGLCGETCPPLCRKCNPEEVTDIFFGTEDEPDARFIYLQECKHTLEVTSMDYHMESKVVENGVSVKKCPKCNTVIRNCKRYGSILNDGRKDVVAIKKKINGMDQRIQNKLWTMACNLHDSIEEPYLAYFRDFLQAKTYTFKDEVTKKGKIWRTKLFTNKKMNQYLFESVDNMMAWWVDASRDLKIAGKFRKDYLLNLSKRYNSFFGELMKRVLPLSRQEISDFDTEFQKISSWHKLYRRASLENFDSFPAAPYKMNQISQFLIGMEYKKFNASSKETFTKYLKELDLVIIQNVKTWKAEEENVKARRDVFTALAFGAQHWYKCPNGHLYVIGDCGLPNQTSVCPECKCSIGAAQYHVLASGNANAAAEVTSQSTSGRVIPDIGFLENGAAN